MRISVSLYSRAQMHLVKSLLLISGTVNSIVRMPLLFLCRSEHEKNRRRDLVTALRNRREQMQLSLKRDRSQQNR